MSKLLRELLKNVKKLAIAFSGGMDSTVLLNFLANYREKNKKLPLRVFYIHHGLSHNSNTWEKHCENICQKKKINYFSVRVKIQKNTKGLESYARDVRYKSITKLLQP